MSGQNYSIFISHAAVDEEIAFSATGRLALARIFP
jgi:hypothetical protein